MKKFIVLSLAGLLIIGFSTTVFAQIDFKTYGNMNAGFIWSRNFGGASNAITSNFNPPFQPSDPTVAPANSGAWNRPVSFYSEWANIFFEWNAGKEVTGVFNIETVDYHSGTNTTPNGAGDHAGAAFDTGLWDTRLPETRLRQAYVRFGVPYFGLPVPVTVSAGIIPMGIRVPFMWATTEGAGFQIDVKADPAAFSFTWGKMAEGKIAVADDSNWYSLAGSANLGPATVGGYVIYNNMKTYPIVYNETAYGAPSSNNDAKLWWFGVYADAKAGPINLNFDLGIDNGKVRGREAALGFVPDVKYSGWASQLKITFPWEKFSFGALGLYASGADLKKTNQNGLAGSLVSEPSLADFGVQSSKVGSWVFPAGDVQWVIWGESLFLGGNAGATAIAIPQGLQAGNWNVQANRGATGGTWVAKLFASVNATPWYKVTLWGLYIGDTTKNGNTLGNARKADGRLRDDNDIGWELSLIQDIQIYKNLKLSLGSGILFAGDALDQYVPGSSEPARNKSPSNPYMFSSNLVFVF